MKKFIVDHNRVIMHRFNNENDFIFSYANYERDPENGRCYILVDSCNLHDPNMDGALVKKRIKKTEYENALAECKKIFDLNNK